MTRLFKMSTNVCVLYTVHNGYIWTNYPYFWSTVVSVNMGTTIHHAVQCSHQMSSESDVKRLPSWTEVSRLQINNYRNNYFTHSSPYKESKELVTTSLNMCILFYLTHIESLFIMSMVIMKTKTKIVINFTWQLSWICCYWGWWLHQQIIVQGFLHGRRVKKGKRTVSELGHIID